jgi:CBS domain containing-hemolysin-like protein
MQWVLFPFVWVTKKFADLFVGGAEAHSVSEEEILAIVHMGATAGEITHDEKKLVHNIIELENNLLRDVMTPRTVVFMQEASKTVDEALPLVLREGFSRIPVFEGDRENILGYVMIQDLVTVKERGGADRELKSLAKPITFVPRSVNCLTQLSVFLKQRSHVAVVVDEYGGVAGLVTLEDVLETLLGTEIVDERDKEVDLQKKARRNGGTRFRDAALSENGRRTKDEA